MMARNILLNDRLGFHRYELIEHIAAVKEETNSAMNIKTTKLH